MYSIRRSCHLALRESNHALSLSNGSRRAFSRSCALSRGALPVFLEPSTPELSTLLSTLNRKVLLPCLLTKEQEQLVYQQENRAKLDAEPVEITLGDVTVPLEHIDRNTQLPNRWKHFREIVKQSKTKEDWENVIRMLEGFQNAGIPLKPERQELAIRHLTLNGMQHLILKALQRPKATGVRLSNWRVLIMVLRGVHDKAVLADWDEEETTKALRYAKQIVELMDDEEHCGGRSRGAMNNDNDWRGKPVVVALPTEMAAVLADKYGGDKTEVRTLANRMVNAFKQNGNMTADLEAISRNSTKTSTDFPNKPKQLGFATDHAYDLLQLAIVWNALKTSRSVLGADMPMAEEAQQYETKVKEALMQGLQSFDTILKTDAGHLPLGISEYVKNVVEKCR